MIDLNYHFNLHIIYIEFRRYLLRIDSNMLTQKMENAGTHFTLREISRYNFKYASPKIGEGFVSGPKNYFWTPTRPQNITIV